MNKRKLYGMGEIAKALGLDSTQKVRQWRMKGLKGMPAPDHELDMGPVWEAPTIEPFIREVLERLDTERWKQAGIEARKRLL